MKRQQRRDVGAGRSVDHDRSSSDRGSPGSGSTGRDLRSQVRQMPAWKMGLVVLSVLISVGGLVLMGYASATREAGKAAMSVAQGDGGVGVVDGGVGGTGGTGGAGGAAVSGFTGSGGSPSGWPSGPTLPGGLPNPFPDGAPGPSDGGDPTRPTPGPTQQPGQTTPDPRFIDDASPALFRLGFSFFVGFTLAFAFRRFVRVSLVGIGVLFFLMFGLSYLGLIEVRWDAASGVFDRLGGWLSEQFSGFRAFVTGHLPSAASAGAGMVVGYRKN